MCSLKAKVARQSGQLEALHSIRLDLRMLKQLGREVQEAEVKINHFEKALKGLQRVVEVLVHTKYSRPALPYLSGNPARGNCATA